MPSAKDYAKRVHENTILTLDSHLTSLQKALGDLKEHFTASSSQVEQSLAFLRDPDALHVEAVLAEAMKEAGSAAARDAREDKERTLGFMAHFAHELRTKETQDEILNLLLDAAVRFAPRVALFVAREAEFRGWSSRGFSPEKTRGITEWSCTESDSPFLLQSLQSNVPTSRGQRSADVKLADLLGEEAQTPWHAFPMRAIRRPVAVLLAAPAIGRTCELEPLCILLDLTGLSIENLALKILQEAGQAAPQAQARPPAHAPAAGHTAGSDATRAPEAAPAPEAVSQAAAAPAELAATEVRVEEPAEQPQPAEPEVSVPPEPGPAPEAGAVAVEAVAAAPGEQATAATEAAPPVPTAPPAAEPAAEAEAPKAGRLREVQPQTEEEKLHSDARRFARLLVTEIKLYNEQAVVDGRVSKDLYSRLKRDVDRSRDMYEKRVSPAVARQADYFHDEIIRILAGSDPSALGEEYPGPRVAG